MEIKKTKASTLKFLKLKSAFIPKLISFEEKKFIKNKDNILDFISKNFQKKIAIRSSHYKEDQKKNSYAGYFKSFLNINKNAKTNIEVKIKEVFKSYLKAGPANKKNEVIIQNMVSNVLLSGVVTSCDKDNFTPYYVVNFTKSNDTSKITSGALNGSTFVYYKRSKSKPSNKYLIKIINLVDELCRLFGPALDIEFAFDKKGAIYLLQVRNIIKNKNYSNVNLNFSTPFNKLTKKIKKLKSRHYNLFGKTNLFGVMPDWNPAEIIGIKPNNLALSLYGNLITDKIWAADRKKFGFKDVTSHHLLTNFFGAPYVDVRVDFNSWIPNKLSNKVSEKLINFYLNKYRKKTEFHDKIEFNIIFTCFTFSTQKKLQELKSNGFSKKEIDEISSALKEITKNSFQILKASLSDVQMLNKSQDKIIDSKIYEIDKIYWLIEDCKKYGTSSFASIARCAFIANDFLNSLEEHNIFTKNDRMSFLATIKTIVSEMNEDLLNLQKKDFINKYGHLRPSTYDISSFNYKEKYNTYFTKKINIPKKIKKFSLTQAQFKKIKKLLNKEKISISVQEFLEFIKLSIAQREKIKFYFSKNINLVFEMLIKIGKRNNINRQDLGFININTILDLYHNLDLQNLETKLKSQIKENKKNYKYNSLIKLPKNIISEKDIFFFTEKYPKSNFIADGDVTGTAVYVNKLVKENLSGKIVCIESADPGYDFIFSKNIKGLVTMFGGINSHMAIRCSELNIPAAIGVGSNIFENIKSSKTIRLNTKIEKIDIIS